MTWSLDLVFTTMLFSWIFCLGVTDLYFWFTVSFEWCTLSRNSCIRGGCVCAQLLSWVWHFVTPWTVAFQTPLSMGFSRQEYWSGLPFPPPGDLPNPGIEPVSLNLLQERGPLPGPETGLFSNTRKWIVWGDTCWQSKRFYWERAPGWRAVGKRTQEKCSAAWLAVLGFMVMGLVSGWLWPIILIQSLSWLHTHRSDKMDAGKRDSGKWTDR